MVKDRHNLDIALGAKLLMKQPLNEAQLAAGFKELDDLAYSEYGLHLSELLEDRQVNEAIREARLHRLVGILLKRPFASSVEISGHGSETEANFAWDWYSGEQWDRSLMEPEKAAAVEVLTGIRDSAFGDSTEWGQFKAVVDHERGLFKVASLWILHKIRSEPPGSFNDLLNAKENPNFTLALDLSTAMAQLGFSSALATVMPMAGLAVGLSIIFARYGYKRIEDLSMSGGPDPS